MQVFWELWRDLLLRIFISERWIFSKKRVYDISDSNTNAHQFVLLGLEQVHAMPRVMGKCACWVSKFDEQAYVSFGLHVNGLHTYHRNTQYQ